MERQYKKYHLKSDKQKSIVAFNKNTSLVHYFALTPKKLKFNSLILIDIWARLNKKGAPFADISWMMYYGKELPREYIAIFKVISQARNEAIKYLRRNLKKKIIPRGKEIDEVVRNYLYQHKFSEKFLHGAGHSLGTTSPHGRKTRISKKGESPIPLNIGYSIEPGVYFINKFGMRSEVNFYLDSNMKLVITTNIQKNIIKIY
ncbi:MAG: M24 family metallopeptidase [Patescibacteria group bacterium]